MLMLMLTITTVNQLLTENIVIAADFTLHFHELCYVCPGEV